MRLQLPASEPLTCEWLAGPDNCWKNTALMAMSCLPPSADTGTLSADNKMCTYPAGPTVTFTPAIVIPVPDDANWNFTITDAGGAACLHFEDAGMAGFKLVAGADQTVTVGLAGSVGEKITCPDGTSFAIANAFDLLSCPGGGGFLPGIAWGTGATPPFVSTSLVGTGDQSLPLFSCSGMAP